MKQTILLLLVPLILIAQTIEPLSPDTFEDERLMGYEKKQMMRKARGIRAGGIAVVTTGSIVATGGPIFLGFMGMIYENPAFGIAALGSLGIGITGIWGGSRMIRKGNYIQETVELSIVPVVNPWEDQYGAVLSISF